VLNTNLNLNETSLVIAGPTLIKGNLVIPFNSTLEIYVDGYLNISGCLTIHGSLVINAQNQHLASKQIESIATNCIIGTAQSITVSNVN